MKTPTGGQDIGRPRTLKLGQGGRPALLRSHIARFIQKWHEDFTIDETDHRPLLIAALSPEKMNEPECVGLLRDYGRLYAAHPDFVLALLTSIRKEWYKAGEKFKVKKFLMERHGWIDDQTHITSETEKLEVMEKLLADKLKVSPAVVKKARQELAKEHPPIIVRLRK